MWHTTERLLQMLSLLSRGATRNARSLAAEFAVTERTVRRDVDRLRELGYPITTVHGAGGGYQLTAGATLPPLLFDTEEALAVVVAVRDHATSADPGSIESALRALEKLTAAMPPAVRPGWKDLQDHSSSIDLGSMLGAAPVGVDVHTLALLARSCRTRRQVTCRYRSRHHDSTMRRIEPLHLVRTMGRWYLVAYCLDANGWRTFRLDRIDEPVLTTTKSRQRRPPADDLHDYVIGQLAAAWRTVTATVRIHAPAEHVAQWIRPAWGSIHAETSTTCLVECGADSYHAIARWLLLVDAPLTVIQPAQLCAAFNDLAHQLHHIAEQHTTRPSSHVRPDP